ncbi:MAG: class I SAM-dependent methyltransferase, partial [bacterium]
CGSGRALNLMARSFPNSRFAGYDLSEGGIATANAAAAEQGSKNIRFAVKDVTDLSEPAAYDLITAFDAIHDQARPDRVLKGIADALKPDGTFFMLDIRASSEPHKNRDHPVGPFLYTISTMHCMTVSLAENGMGLGAMWGEEKAREMLRDAGFGKVEVKQLPHDFQNSFYIVRKS